MAYCRWSSDNWKCDLYCYEDVAGGWTTHVAGRRRVGVENLPPEPLSYIQKITSGEMTGDEWRVLYREHREAVQLLPFEDITLPSAGETFRDMSLEEFKARLLSLRELGYYFPDYVLEEIDEEIRERDTPSVSKSLPSRP